MTASTPALIVKRLVLADDLDRDTGRRIVAGVDTHDPAILTDAVAALLAARTRIRIHCDGRDDVLSLYRALLSPLATEDAHDAWSGLTRVAWESELPMEVDRRLIAHVPRAAAAWDRRFAERAALADAVPVMTAALARKVVDLRARSTAA